MELTREGLVLAAFLMIPGFIYFSVSRNFRTPDPDRPSDARVLLESLTVNLVLLTLEVSTLALVAVFADGVRDEIELVFQDGLDAYIDENAITFFYVVVAVGAANLIVMFVAGWFDWTEAAIQKAQQRRGLAPWSVWYQMLRLGPEPQRKRTTPIGVRVHLKSGGLYHGALAAFSLRQSEAGRDVALWEVSFSESGKPEDLKAVSSK
ncbi:MAG: hypothetical protein IH989_05560, partial [Planctomycetes bacterium]|nr:hypothetical protein [Planctomycetota bacterium]